MRALKTCLLTACLMAAPLGGRAAGGFTLISPDFVNGGTIPMAQAFDRSGCRGKSLSPALRWSGAPSDTRSYAITIYDPDARGGWWHWLVFDIPANVSNLPAGAGAEHSRSLPRGAVQGRNSFGLEYYGGPCPPPGDAPHHYQITVYALGIAKLPESSSVTGAALARALAPHTLAKARLVGLYGRNQ